MDIVRAGKTLFHGAALVAALGLMGVGMRPQAPGGGCAGAVAPADFPPAPPSVCVLWLRALRREHRRSPCPRARAGARADYNALAAQVDADTLRRAGLPPRLPPAPAGQETTGRGPNLPP